VNSSRHLARPRCSSSPSPRCAKNQQAASRCQHRRAPGLQLTLMGRTRAAGIATPTWLSTRERGPSARRPRLSASRGRRRSGDRKKPGGVRQAQVAPSARCAQCPLRPVPAARVLQLRAPSRDGRRQRGPAGRLRSAQPGSMTPPSARSAPRLSRRYEGRARRRHAELRDGASAGAADRVRDLRTQRATERTRSRARALRRARLRRVLRADVRARACVAGP
jgi:hypothetical protein